MTGIFGMPATNLRPVRSLRSAGMILWYVRRKRCQILFNEFLISPSSSVGELTKFCHDPRRRTIRASDFLIFKARILAGVYPEFVEELGMTALSAVIFLRHTSPRSRQPRGLGCICGHCRRFHSRRPKQNSKTNRHNHNFLLLRYCRSGY